MLGNIATLFVQGVGLSEAIESKESLALGKRSVMQVMCAFFETVSEYREAMRVDVQQELNGSKEKKRWHRR